MISSISFYVSKLRNFELRWPHVFGLIVVVFVGLTVFYAWLGYLGHFDTRIRGHDSVYYYSYLRSLVLDGDLNFENEWAHFYTDSSNRPYQENVFSVGPAIFWSPFFLAAHAITCITGWFPADGYSALYQAFVYGSNGIYGLAGLLLIAYYLKSYVSLWATLLSCLGILLASPLTYYFWSMTTMSHNVSLFSVVMFLCLWDRKGLHPITAISAALMVLARWQNSLFLLLPIFVGVIDLIKHPLTWRILVRRHVVFGIVLIIFLSPQCIVWQYMFGQFLLVPQGTGFLNFFNLQLVDVLFSTRHGLFVWHPLLFLGLIGLCFCFKSMRLKVFLLWGIFVCLWGVNASVQDWWAGWSFGQRRFINFLPVFALGFGFLVVHLRVVFLPFVVVILLGFWNQAFIYQYQHGLIPRGGHLTFQEIVTDKFRLQRLFQTQKAVNTAVQKISQGDQDQFVFFAEMAHKLAPDYRNSLLVYGLVCMLREDVDAGLHTFETWYQSRPNDQLAYWGYAEFLRMQNNYEKALDLLEQVDSNENSARLFLLQKKMAQGVSLIDEDFFNIYRQRLLAISTE